MEPSTGGRVSKVARGYLRARGALLGCGMLAVLAGCAGSPLKDPRAQSLLTLSGPEFFAEDRVARDLANRCAAYGYDAEVAQAVRVERTKRRKPAVSFDSSAIDLETDVKQRTLAARYGGSSYSGLKPCTVLDGEAGRNTPLSVLVTRDI